MRGKVGVKTIREHVKVCTCAMHTTSEMSKTLMLGATKLRPGSAWTAQNFNPKVPKGGSGSARASARGPKKARCVCKSKMRGGSFRFHGRVTVPPRAKNDASNRKLGSERQRRTLPMTPRALDAHHARRTAIAEAPGALGEEHWAGSNSCGRQRNCEGKRGAVLHDYKPT